MFIGSLKNYVSKFSSVLKKDFQKLSNKEKREIFMTGLLRIKFALNFTKPIMIPFVLALFIRILIDPIIDFQTHSLKVHRIIAVFVSLLLMKTTTVYNYDSNNALHKTNHTQFIF